MLYTRKGDKGTSKLFDCKEGERIGKDAFVFEVLGSLDELNSSLGFARALSHKESVYIHIENKKNSFESILESFQNILFSIQAEIGGSDIHPKEEHIVFLENVIYEIELLIPPVKSFVVSGGSLSGAYLDVARTIARRTERHVIMLRNKKERIVSDTSVVFLNRLSSALYAMARLANYALGHTETGPKYSV